MTLTKWKRSNCTGKEIELWLSLKFTCDFQLLLLKNKSVLWICILSKGIVVCTIFKEWGLCYSFSVLHPAWFPSCARFNGVEERKGFFYRGDFVACADLAAPVSTPSPHICPLFNWSGCRFAFTNLFYNSLCATSSTTPLHTPSYSVMQPLDIIVHEL